MESEDNQLPQPDQTAVASSDHISRYIPRKTVLLRVFPARLEERNCFITKSTWSTSSNKSGNMLDRIRCICVPFI